MTEEQKQSIYREYSENNMEKLKQIIYKHVSIFGETNDSMNYDDFLSRANLSLWQLVESFDESKGVPFEAYLRVRIPLKIMQEKTLQNRDMRTQYLRDKNGKKIEDENGKFIELKPVYINAIDEDGNEFGDKLPSRFNLEDELSEEIGLSSEEEWHEEVKEYLKSLSPLQEKIIRMISEKYEREEICEELHITISHYENSLNRITSSEKIKILQPLVERMNKRCSY